ncbi:MAG: aminotransferase class I/II-fold pyridoxal phosphate-dependent enzyme [Bacteroidales bacterium]|nr:aminotransferase class I/II-fold pyridoxal phosphate-dependent enzyme [Bacteroidales bacterium]
MKTDPSTKIFDLLQFGEYGDVNPSICDSATFTFMQAKTMLDTFHGDAEGCYLYSRHWNPSNKYLADALAVMEGTESAWVTASGMAAITCAIFQLCGSGDHIVCSQTIYGGTFAFLYNYVKKFNIDVTFVEITKTDEVKKAIRPNTKLIYTETVSNPLLQITDIPALAKIANDHHIKLVVDNTFTPMIVAPYKLGAHIVVYSMTKFINGKNDCVAGAICASKEFIDALSNVNDGTAMLLGPALDPMRSSGILKNLHTLHIRMKQHGKNADYLARKFKEYGVKVNYPGLESHPGHAKLKEMMNPDFGFGGLMTIDMVTAERAAKLMEMMEKAGVGYLAVSLGYFKTLFSNSGKSTSSEVPEEIQREMGLSEGLVRFSVGLDNDIENSWQKIKSCLDQM